MELCLAGATILMGAWYALFADASFPMYAGMIKTMPRWAWGSLYGVVGGVQAVMAIRSWEYGYTRTRRVTRLFLSMLNAGVWFWVFVRYSEAYWQAPVVPITLLIAIGWAWTFLRIKV